jgi:hypothetical protein
MKALRIGLMVASVISMGCFGALGSGREATQAREVGAFRRLQVHGGIQATVTQGARAVSITADDNLLSLIETRVEGDVLIIRTKEGTSISTSKGLRAAISNDVLEGVQASGGSIVSGPATTASTWRAEASGGSRITLTGLSTTAGTLVASGGSTLTIAGAVTDLTVNASGGSTGNLGDLSATRVILDVAGGSTVKLGSAESVTGSASGGSTVTIKSARSVTVDASGGSSVTTN